MPAIDAPAKLPMNSGGIASLGGRYYAWAERGSKRSRNTSPRRR